jgi:branched-chain amino acid transport system substrate-binding protein
MHLRLTLLAAAAIAALALSACGGNGSSSSSGGAAGGGKSDILVGHISTLSGGIPFVEVPKGAKAYFDKVNAAGGIDGHKIKFESFDDKGDPSEAAQLARKLVLQERAVAMVGNTSLTDCDTNKAFYESQKIGVIGVGPQPTCYRQPNWMPINSGPYVSNQILLKYAYDNLKAQNVCVIGQNEPTSIPSWKLQIADFEKSTGHKLALVSFANDPTQNPTPMVVKAKGAGCDALIIHTIPPNFVAFVKAAKSVGLDASILCLGSAYDESVPATLGKLAEPGALGPKSKGLFVSSELAPWTTDDPALKDMKAGLKAAGVTLNFWSQSGWLSAETFVNGVKGKLNGDITKDSVLKDLQTMKPFDTPQAGSPLVFGPDKTHSPNLSARMVTIKDGAWTPASQDWTTVPLPRFAS